MFVRSAALTLLAVLQWSALATSDPESNCAMQVGIIRRRTSGDFGDDDTPAKAEATVEDPAIEGAAEEEPTAAESEEELEAAAEDPAVAEDPADAEAEVPTVELSSATKGEPAMEGAGGAAGVISDAPEGEAEAEAAPEAEAEAPEAAEAAEEEEEAPEEPVPASHAGHAGHASQAGHAARAGHAGHAGHAGQGKWAELHKQGAAGAGKNVDFAGKHGGKSAGKWAGKAKRANATETDAVAVMIERFLNKKAPPKNEAVSDHAPLVFMHQHRAGGTTMRKLLYNMSVNLKLNPHIMCSGGVSCREFKNTGDEKAAVYGGQFCWRELMGSLPEKKVSCLTSFREPLARIQSCYTNRLVHTKKIAPACMGKLDATKLKSLLQNYGCVHEPFRRLGHCGLKPGDMKEKKARMLSWNTTLEHLSECVPVLVDKQETYAAAVKYFPQFKQVFWQMKKLKLNENQYEEDCEIPETHMAVMKELAAEELLLYDAAHKRAVNLNKHAV